MDQLLRAIRMRYPVIDIAETHEPPTNDTQAFQKTEATPDALARFIEFVGTDYCLKVARADSYGRVLVWQTETLRSATYLEERWAEHEQSIHVEMEAMMVDQEGDPAD